MSCCCKPSLDERKTKKCVQWAKDNLTKNWDAIAFCDEANIEMGKCPNHPRVTHRPSEEDLAKCVVPTF